MKSKHLGSWSEFQEELALSAKRKLQRSPLYRGQRSSEWKLETTLERYGFKNYPVRHYLEDMRKAVLAVETVTGKKWELGPATDGYLKRDDDIHVTPMGYSFMAFLRQNGFPSPLLDWSRSPYVAAFFAFSTVEPHDDRNVAIFEYIETEDGSRSDSSTQASIHPLGPWISTDRKHFLQQSEYTVCRKDGPDGNGGIQALAYVSHEEAFGRGSESQDVLMKYTIPSTEKTRAMSSLQLMNVTRYSLFESMEGLMDVMAADILGKR